MKPLLAIGALVVLPLAANAQQIEEILVSGTRTSNYYDDIVPVIHLKRRADFMVLGAFIESDSRNEDTRRGEVEKTLVALRRRVESADGIELGLAKEFETEDDTIEYVVPFEPDNVEIVRGRRPDTSRVEFVIKTPISDADDSPDKVYSRIADFVESVSFTGRAVVDTMSEPHLSIVNIDQYREPLLRALAEDNASVREIFGDGYRVVISGLEQPVRWQMAGPMQLAIYFPYESTVQPD